MAYLDLHLDNKFNWKQHITVKGEQVDRKMQKYVLDTRQKVEIIAGR